MSIEEKDLDTIVKRLAFVLYVQRYHENPTEMSQIYEIIEEFSNGY